MNAPSTADRPVVVIRPSKGWVDLSLNELWVYRELVYFLAVREIKVRYKQTAVGVAWAVIQPVMTMVVFSVFFGRLGKMPSEGVPYPLFSFSGLVPWTFFVNGLAQSSNSLVGNANLITKVYFPRLVIPIAAILSGLLDFLIAFGLLVIMMIGMGYPPDWKVLWLPFFLLLAVTTSLGVGLWLSALNVEYRDVRYIVPFLSQFWMFATPIAYSSSLLSEPWRTLYGLNPMVGVVEGFRWCLLGRSSPPGAVTAVSAAIALLLLISGLFYFRRMERTFADVV
ncbi:MAG TPA: phosphate ABC transporter permease [Solibacterales bacterium]|nr:phosphate ABC transporter permease [Bryobacterales bacterium]